AHRPESLVLAVLDLLERFGDGSAVGPVERLARLTPVKRVRLRAEEVLPVLRERLESEQNATHLLRASAETRRQEELLRPSEGSREKSEELLRAEVEGMR